MPYTPAHETMHAVSSPTFKYLFKLIPSGYRGKQYMLPLMCQMHC